MRSRDTSSLAGRSSAARSVTSVDLSVVIPTFNRGESTRRAIESVSRPNRIVVDILVVDDAGSQVFTWDAATNSHGVSVHVIRSEVNRGPGGARALGVASTNAAYIAFLDSDDAYADGWLIALEALILGGRLDDAVAVGNAIGGSGWSQRLHGMMLSMPEGMRLFACKLVVGLFNPFYTPSIAADRNLLRFHPNLRFCEDYYTLGLAVLHAQSLRILPVPACELGRAPGSAGGESSLRSRMWRGELMARAGILAGAPCRLCFAPLFALGVVSQLFRTGMKWLALASLNGFSRRDRE